MASPAHTRGNPSLNNTSPVKTGGEITLPNPVTPRANKGRKGRKFTFAFFSIQLLRSQYLRIGRKEKRL